MGYRVVRNELYHHGIKNQRWGERNGPPYPLDKETHSKIVRSKNDSKKKKSNNKEQIKSRGLNPEQAEKIGKALKYATIGVGLAGGTYLAYKYGAIDKIEKIPGLLTKRKSDIIPVAKRLMIEAKEETDLVLKSDTEIHRMASIANSKLKDASYVSYEKLDRIFYKYGLRDWSKTGKRYDVSIKLDRDIVGPNRKKAEEIFNNIWVNDETFRKDIENTLIRQLKQAGYSEEKAIQKASIMMYEDYFRSSMRTLVIQDSPSTKKMIDEYIKRGYDYIEDYVDKGHISNNPIVLLKPERFSKIVKQTQVNTSNKSNRKLAKRLLVDGNHPGAYGWS